MREIKYPVLVFIIILMSFGLSKESAILSQKLKKVDLINYGDLYNIDRIPYNLMFMNRDDSPYAILAEKSSQMLYLYSIEDKPRLLNIYSCSTGRVTGNKKEIGDHKTPEGIYYFEEIKEDEELPEEYGVRAFVMNYPNKFDRLEQKNGYGIWLHATDEPDRAKLSNNTKGCIIVNNEDMIDLSNYISLSKTPIIIEKEIVYLYHEQTSDYKNEVEMFINKWLENWENRDINGYMENYSEYFYSQKKNWKKWRNYKRELFNRYSWINVEVDDLSILKKEDNYIINFEQKFISDQYSDQGVKKLYICKNNGKFKIIGEEWKPGSDVPIFAERNEKRVISNGR